MLRKKGGKMNYTGKTNLRSLKASRDTLKRLILPKINDEEENIDKVVYEMFNKSLDKYFRGWILPNGQAISQYRNEKGNRQDHSKIIKLFIKGMKEQNMHSYLGLMNLYQKYVSNNFNCNDIYESFAVEYLGWIQVSENGQKRIICRGEKWQDKYIGPFINGYNFNLEIVDRGNCYDYLFPNLYDNSKEVIAKELKKAFKQK